MPFYALKMSATFNHVEKVSLDEDYIFHFIIQCGNCRTDTSNTIAFPVEKEVELANENVNFEMKCKFCSRNMTIALVDGSMLPNQTDGKPSSIAKFDFRGCSPIRFEQKEGFIVTSLSGQKFIIEEGDIDTDYYAYDERDQTEVSLQDIQFTVDSIKKP